MATVMRVLETALTLNDEVTGSQASLDKAHAKIHKLKGINEKLKGDILNHETKFEAQVQLLKDLNELRPQLDVATKENERLVAKIKEMEGIMAPAEEESCRKSHGDHWRSNRMHLGARAHPQLWIQHTRGAAKFFELGGRVGGRRRRAV